METMLRGNCNLPFSNRTKAAQAKLDAAVLRALERATWTVGACGGGPLLYNYCTRNDIAIMITSGMLGVTHNTIHEISPMVSASCKRLLALGLIVEGARKYARRGTPDGRTYA